MLIITRKFLAQFVRDERGASAVEYAILVGAIGAVLAVGANTYATSLTAALTGLIHKVGLS